MYVFRKLTCRIIVREVLGIVSTHVTERQLEIDVIFVIFPQLGADAR